MTLINIADALNVSMDYLIGRVPSPNDTISAEMKSTYGLTDFQEKMLRSVMESIVPIITGCAEK